MVFGEAPPGPELPPVAVVGLLWSLPPVAASCQSARPYGSDSKPSNPDRNPQPLTASAAQNACATKEWRHPSPILRIREVGLVAPFGAFDPAVPVAFEPTVSFVRSVFTMAAYCSARCRVPKGCTEPTFALMPLRGPVYNYAPCGEHTRSFCGIRSGAIVVPPSFVITTNRPKAGSHGSDGADRAVRMRPTGWAFWRGPLT
jgi:hypothetical protein